MNSFSIQPHSSLPIAKPLPAGATFTDAVRTVWSIFRLGARSAWLSAELARAAADFLATVVLPRHPSKHGARAQWLQRTCRRALKVFNLEVHASGPVPQRGLLVSNHLGYLDVLVIGALAPSIFISKLEVRRWPVFGWFARWAGTIFVDRSRRLDVGRCTQAMTAALERGRLLVLFPEGTSSSGSKVLPFRPALLGPVRASSWPLAVCGLNYFLEGGDVEEELCYWRDMTLLPHLLNLLRKPGASVRVQFGAIDRISSERKELARLLHLEVTKLVNAPTLHRS